jgi:hypothetical protein
MRQLLALILTTALFAADTYQPPGLVRKGIIPTSAAAAASSSSSLTKFVCTAASNAVSCVNAADIPLQKGDTTNQISAATRTITGGAGTCDGFIYENGGTVYVGTNTTGSCSATLSAGFTSADVTAYPVNVNKIGRFAISAGVIQNSFTDDQASQKAAKTLVGLNGIDVSESAETITFTGTGTLTCTTGATTNSQNSGSPGTLATVTLPDAITSGFLNVRAFITHEGGVARLPNVHFILNGTTLTSDNFSASSGVREYHSIRVAFGTNAQVWSRDHIRANTANVTSTGATSVTTSGSNSIVIAANMDAGALGAELIRLYGCEVTISGN